MQEYCLYYFCAACDCKNEHCLYCFCVDGDGSVPVESAKADGLDAVARVGVAADHRGIVCDHHVFRIIQHWLHAVEPDPFYDPLNDYVILPTAFEIEKHHGKRGNVTSVREDWEIISTIVVHPESKGRQHVEVRAVGIIH
ncbi:hypothetical protein ABZP36_034859 [Zizania latifolia]